ncbi:MAG: hypothetical protein AB1942_12160 [Pseudomonadota bacterium]
MGHKVQQEQVKRAAESLARVEAAVAVLKAVGPKPKAEEAQTVLDAWSDVLTYGNRVFTRLEQGAKVGAAKGWFDGVKHLRRTDELLSYMLHARNADEHGLHSVADDVPSSVTVSAPRNMRAGEMLVRPILADEPGPPNIIGWEPGPRAKVTEFKPRHIALRAVYDRSVRYELPSRHMDTDIADLEPATLADLFASYLAKLVLELGGVPKGALAAPDPDG